MNYDVVTCIHGLRRTGEANSRPIAPGETIELPDEVAAALGDAVRASESEATIELDFTPFETAPAAGLIDPTDLGALTRAAAAVGAVVLSEGDAIPLERADNGDLLAEVVLRRRDGRFNDLERLSVLNAFAIDDAGTTAPAPKIPADHGADAAQDTAIVRGKKRGKAG